MTITDFTLHLAVRFIVIIIQLCNNLIRSERHSSPELCTRQDDDEKVI